MMLSVLLLASLACGLSDLTGETTAPQQSTEELQAAVVRSLAETAQVQTAIAQGVAGTLSPTQQGLPELPSLTPTNTFSPMPELPSLTPTITFSPTPEKVILTVSQLTNCRTGPGSVYDWVGALNVGEQAEVIARDPANSSWYIRNPNNSSGFCWIYGTYASVTGNSGALPVFTPMPTPTPAKTATPTIPPMDFSVVSNWIMDCSGIGEYWINIEVVNTGDVTWQSWKTIMTDTVTAQTKITYGDIFHFIVGCASSTLQHDLTKGEPGGVYSGDFVDDPTGHLMTATITLCTLDDLGGTCKSKEVSFTP
ncbi:MAG: hypothetical protein A2X25_08125 [Chloroflexi bacterium GWB2_49_20]|nr:MAG: hypothetical protein A2X25_08125 [Chloroflexi bacterium GWB2_49_20]OGN79597.1 MAG: hypothetical protein A2X26_05900 [Chloroflexi bacterium GWC2_49_37]